MPGGEFDLGASREEIQAFSLKSPSNRMTPLASAGCTCCPCPSGLTNRPRCCVARTRRILRIRALPRSLPRPSSLGLGPTVVILLDAPTKLPQPVRTGADRLAARGLACAALGLSLVLLGRFVWRATASMLCSAGLILPGLSLILHFGIFNLVTAAWRVAGVSVEPLLPVPLASTP